MRENLGTVDQRPTAPAMRPPTVKIILKDHSEAQTYAPHQGSCQDSADKGGREGCGATLFFYYTHPNRKRMPFDGPPVVVEQWPVGMDGLVVAEVESLKVHFGTCPHARANEENRRKFYAAERRAQKGAPR